MANKPFEIVGFGGGCHWCTEAVFQHLHGVKAARQGFISSEPPNDQWSEAVEVEFDPDQIRLEDLLAVHLATHASTSNHKMRGKYRSAAYYLNEDTGQKLNRILAELGQETEQEFVTQIIPHRGFRSSDERFQNYYSKDPSRPFCETYINPKLSKLRQRYGDLLKPANAVEPAD